MKPLKILIAEDDAGHFALVRKNIERICADAEIIRFRNGKELLNYFFDNNGNLNQNQNAQYLLLLDIKMPLVDGVSALKILRSSPELKKMPIFMLTTTDNPAEINRCYQLGCNFYIVKSSDYTEFTKTLENLSTILLIPGLIIPEINFAPISTYN